MYFKQQQNNKSQSSASKLQTKKSKDINKLIFNFNDFSQAESQDDDNDKSNNNNGTKSNINKLQKLRSIKGSNNSKIIPSLMRANQQEDIYTYEQQNEKVGNKFKSNPQKVNNFVVFDLSNKNVNEQIDIQFPPKLTQKYIQNKSQISYASINPQKIQQIQSKNSVRNNERQLFVQDSSVIIISSLSEPNLEFEQSKKKNQQNKRRSSFLYEIDSDSENRDQQINSIDEQISDAATCVQQKLSQIVHTSQKINAISSELATKLSKFQDIHNIRIFLTTPIPQNIYFNFEIHKYKNFLKTQYQLWLQHQNTMTLFATSINDKIYIEKTVFRFNICPPGRQKIDKQSLFIGELVSDFKRETFTLYDHKNYSNPRQNDKILCSVVTVPNFINSKLKTQQFYIPKLIDKSQITIFNSTVSKNKNLKKLRKLPSFEQKIQKFTTHSLPQYVIQKFREQFKVLTNTTRNALVKHQKNIKFLFLKMQQNRFKIRSGSGITPIQLLAYATAHLQ